MIYSNQMFAIVLVLFAILKQAEPLARLVKFPLQRATTQSAGIFGQPVISYYTPIGIGTPPVSFNISFAIDLNDLFLPHYSWNPFNRNMHYSAGFKCKSSSTCKKDDNSRDTEYQNCRLTGKRYWDTISVKNVQLDKGNETNDGKHGLTTWRQNFLAISSASDGRFSSLPVDGFFGLAPTAQTQSSLTNPLISLREANLIDNLQFSFVFNPVIDSDQGGELILGGVDPTRYQGQIYWHPLSTLQANEWRVKLQQVVLGQQVIGCSASSSGCQAKFSTGLSDSYGPAADVQTLYSILNTSLQDTGLQLIDCRRIPQMPILIFNIDGIQYSLLPSNYIRKTTDGRIFKQETCYVAILPQTNGPANEWTLGTNFLGAYYSVFDMTYSQVGFATLR